MGRPWPPCPPPPSDYAPVNEWNSSTPEIFFYKTFFPTLVFHQLFKYLTIFSSVLFLAFHMPTVCISKSENKLWGRDWIPEDHKFTKRKLYRQIYVLWYSTSNLNEIAQSRNIPCHLWKSKARATRQWKLLLAVDLKSWYLVKHYLWFISSEWKNKNNIALIHEIESCHPVSFLPICNIFRKTYEVKVLWNTLCPCVLLSYCLCVGLSRVFLQNCSLEFSDLLQEIRVLPNLNSDGAPFFEKILLWGLRAKRAHNGHKMDSKLGFSSFMKIQSMKFFEYFDSSYSDMKV